MQNALENERGAGFISYGLPKMGRLVLGVPCSKP